jgi:hypothetical protein
LEKLEKPKRPKDDWEVKKEKEDSFLNNNYWKLPDQYGIDELLLSQQEDPKVFVPSTSTIPEEGD